MYWKEIIYMNLFENEIKKDCVGYLKSEKKQDKYEVEVQVKKLPAAMTGSFPLRLQSETGWQEMGMLVMKEGGGKWNGSLKETVLRAEIIVSDAEKIKGQSRQEQVKQEQVKQEQVRQEQSKQEQAKQEQSRQEQSKQEQIKPEEVKREESRKEQVTEKQRNEEAENTAKIFEMDSEKEEAKETEIVMRAESMTMPQSRPVGRKAVIRTEQTKTAPGHTPLYENKWEQLLATYEQIHPYGDNRIYVKLAPKDFIVLRESYQHLVNNSFLLHGFYNYRYLILGKEGGFYLGVPGVFYEREKMVALMFGFEAFECEGGEAEEGKFGYYLRKVEL